MCNIDALYEAYHKHTGYPETETYHTEKVRLARLAIAIHLKTCDECRRDAMHSNYNLVEPAHPGYKRQPGRRRKSDEIVTREAMG